MWFLLQMIDHNIHESNEPWCRCITTIYNYFVVTNFFWMFVEGCYLHTAIVMTYSTDKLRKWVFLFIGWCIPCPIIVAWAIGKLYYENEQCWFGKEPGKYIDYIYQGPVILVLLFRIAHYEEFMAKYNHSNYSEISDFTEHIPEDKKEQFKAFISKGQLLARIALQASLNFTDMAARSVATAVVM
ncbi:Corticotropin-releasing factor receptor 2 [Chelonia mydas]|uniref:Corticotropin-releasing factor receptor 2 n=1 Tax=Chelonia mydas TaxID=8469 RepID=M7B1W6_CHEMY|nr:Corticotropin-releasing factor receptor 2 [Chelonia mydas]